MPKRGKVNRIWNSEGWEGKYHNGKLSCMQERQVLLSRVRIGRIRNVLSSWLMVV
jgi:hypothetical protein